ncbi:TPA: hypothetical protein R8G43_004709 [Citrobacter freundii]|uniref:hypothetical protein n=1 Tax=Citrobacter freundii TaxID=546 RepID=UPI0015E92BCB|nr:hypothetical protein [Citrobacter freundii]MDE8795723.1 hypothetical protein [Citrobacter freundii]QLU14068.1 hypothetical protein HV147_09170 [Citrobacter freundii]HCB1820668.1 hypothetical protein [Citrobacter freundii]HEE9834686.1 hypothetical protein [Citrobacter freundii]HEE9896499.1 hypothetical protein [Citrobacter freundii]
MNHLILRNIERLDAPCYIVMLLRCIYMNGYHMTPRLIASSLGVKVSAIKEWMCEANKLGYLGKNDSGLVLNIPDMPEPEQVNSPIQDDVQLSLNRIREWAGVKEQYAAEPIKTGSPEWFKQMRAISKAHQQRTVA